MHIRVKHSEVAPFVEQIQNIIKSPQIVTRDSGGAHHLSRLGDVKKGWDNLYLEVVVRYKETSELKEGNVLTVHFNSNPPKGELEWIKPN